MEIKDSVMKALYSTLKGKFPKAHFQQLNDQTLEVDFAKAKESIIIQQTAEDRYIVSYPKLVQQRSGKIRKEAIVTSSNVLLPGVMFILKQVQKNGKVLPEFY